VKRTSIRYLVPSFGVDVGSGREAVRANDWQLLVWLELDLGGELSEPH
jgi:hypothetical protein